MASEKSMKLIAIGVAALCSLTSLGASEEAEGAPSSPWHYQFYVDAGYAYTDNDPANHEWRSKSTTNKLNEPELFLGMGNVGKKPISGSRWGFELGLQTGADSEGLVTAAPPPALEPIDNADSWRHLYRANFSYLFDAGRAPTTFRARGCRLSGRYRRESPSRRTCTTAPIRPTPTSSSGAFSPTRSWSGRRAAWCWQPPSTTAPRSRRAFPAAPAITGARRSSGVEQVPHVSAKSVEVLALKIEKMQAQEEGLLLGRLGELPTSHGETEDLELPFFSTRFGR